MTDTERGLGGRGLQLTPEVADELATRTGGDARQSLNALELAALLAEADGRAEVSHDDVSEALQRRIVRYDKAGDSHYDVISAFIKSVRGSDPDASLYWLFFMLEAGEDPEFIARRLIILASEDVGLADSNGLGVAVAASQALAYVGLPEAGYHLAHATLYLSTAPKSNSIGNAINAARRLVQEGPTPTVPSHLRSTGYSGAGDLGHGKGYLYPHDDPMGVVGQQYFPDGVDPTPLFHPGEHGDEAELAERLARIDRFLGRKR
jgi:putative ATPase